jgi:hypothetical protein
MSRYSQFAVLVVVLTAVFIRLHIYGDLRLSVANADTASYVESSRANLLSWDAFTSYRPFTTNLIYKAFIPADDPHLSTTPVDSTTTSRKIDPPFDGIVVTQTLLSAVAWAWLAWSFSSHLKHPLMKVVSAAGIMCIAFVPQIADWDSVLSPESLSISLFVLSLGTLIWPAFAYLDAQRRGSWINVALVLFLVSLFLWVFVRDVNAYPLVVLAMLFAGVYVFPRFRNTRVPLILSVIVLLLLTMGMTSARQRPLWQKALGHVWTSDILGYPTRIAYFTARGMPDPGSAEYEAWFNKHAPGTYVRFLLAHPGYTSEKFFRDMKEAFAENMQPYFRANDIQVRPKLVMLGDYLHPKSVAVFPITVFLLLAIYGHIIFQGRSEVAPWAWLMTWVFLATSMTMFLTIFGDSYGLVRHALSSTMMYRTMMWLLLFLVVDLLFTTPPRFSEQPAR